MNRRGRDCMSLVQLVPANAVRPPPENKVSTAIDLCRERACRKIHLGVDDFLPYLVFFVYFVVPPVCSSGPRADRKSAISLDCSLYTPGERAPGGKSQLRGSAAGRL